MMDTDEATTMKLKIGVEVHADSTIYLAIHGTLGAESSNFVMPVSPALARSLADQLWRAAAAGDPDGHRQVLEALAGEMTLHMLPSGTAQH
jgi:hypothetical protein